MKIDIMARFRASVLFSHDAEENTIAITLSAAVAKKADLRGANLGSANLRGADLYGADLRGADLGSANLRGADLRGADLRGANLYGADLRGADLGSANLGSANLRGADLYGADLYGADLYGADLYGADLYGATGNMRELKSLQCEKWPVSYTATHMQIGCQMHPLDDWWAFDDARIVQMDIGALKFWRKWKPILQTIIEVSPATAPE